MDTEKYILINGTHEVISENYKKIATEKSGDDIGHYVYLEATKKIIKEQTNLKLLSYQNYKANQEQYINKIEKVVLNLGNTIIKNKKIRDQISEYNQLIEKINCEKYIFSIGADSGNLHYRNFSESEKKLYTEFFQKFKYCYLRGKYTYNLLKHNDIPLDNLKIVGCPSILLNRVRAFEIKNKFTEILQSFVKTNNLKRYNLGLTFSSKSKVKITNQLKNLMSDPNVYTVALHGVNWSNFINFGHKLEVNNANVDEINKNQKNFVFNHDISKTILYIKENMDLMIGTHIYGVIMGILAGIPSMCIVTDASSFEMCEQMNIPYINCIKKSINFENKNDLCRIFMENYEFLKNDDFRKTLKDNSNLYDIMNLEDG
tara:strand:+ start:206 stop:1324 length:1119 start_codon:yes stop_codon:yes gene_type:complete